jgi:hypothetical protein
MKYEINPRPKYQIGQYVKIKLSFAHDKTMVGEISDYSFHTQCGLRYMIDGYGYVTEDQIICTLYEVSR